MYILGINESVNATASLLKDGEIIACVQEERLTRQKGQSGLPLKSIAYCLQAAHIKIKEVDLVVFGAQNPAAAIWYRTDKRSRMAKFLRDLENLASDMAAASAHLIPFSFTFLQYLYNFLYFFYGLTAPFIKSQHFRKISRRLGVPMTKIMTVDHHLAHGYAAYYSNGKKAIPVVVVTNDGAGDKVCGRIFIVRNDTWKQIANTPNKFSLAYLYYYVTAFLGFTPNEQEYKVMGLAPYAQSQDIDTLLPVFSDLFSLKGLSFRSKYERIAYASYIQHNLREKRFDVIAGAVQKLTEDMLTAQIRAIIKLTKITSIVLGGGIAMNVKANMKIAQIPEVKQLEVCPSAGDESVSIGACYWGYRRYCENYNHNFEPKSLTSIYLGPSYTKSQTLQALRKNGVRNSKKFERHVLTETKVRIARLLAEGHIIARFAGRMEFGARALGNRSILADPRQYSTVQLLNDQIKHRDFWMPFAPVIMKEVSQEYLIDPKHLNSPYMMLGFETTQKAHVNIPAVLHPQDHTCRPQIISNGDNPDLYAIINEFKKLTGIGVLLNTSFNLHGEPIVCSPEDAVSTFLRCNLQYLILDDILIKKR